MKKFFYLLVMITFALSLTLQAQIGDGYKAADFTFTALNNDGEVVHLYEWLDQGKYVIMDVSATWCPPCWSFHQTKALEELYVAHGPGSETDDIRVVFVESDGSTTDADMQGTGSRTQGNWLEGTKYPMCNISAEDASVFNSDYKIGYFPTLYVICPDKTIREVDRSTADALYNQMINTPCPEKISFDVLPHSLSGKLFSCNGDYNFNLTIKNIAFENLTSATINVKSGTQVYGTHEWTGDIESFQPSEEIELNISAVPENITGLTIEVVAENDNDISNNEWTVRIDHYKESNDIQLPYLEGFASAANVPDKFGYLDFQSIGLFNLFDGTTGNNSLIGSDGGRTNGIYFWLARTAGLSGFLNLGNFNTTMEDGSLNFEFDIAYAQRTSENDQIEVLVSEDCAETWTVVMTKAGSDLKTSNPNPSSNFFPSGSSDWRTESVDLSEYKNKRNLLVAIRVTSAGGNLIWLDNFRMMTGGTDVDDPMNATIQVYPNPANDYITISGFNGIASIQDMMGRVIWTSQINDKTNVDIDAFSAGVYYVNLNGKIISFVKL